MPPKHSPHNPRVIKVAPVVPKATLTACFNIFFATAFVNPFLAASRTVVAKSRPVTLNAQSIYLLPVIARVAIVASCSTHIHNQAPIIIAFSLPSSTTSKSSVLVKPIVSNIVIAASKRTSFCCSNTRLSCCIKTELSGIPASIARNLLRF